MPDREKLRAQLLATAYQIASHFGWEEAAKACDAAAQKMREEERLQKGNKQ